MSEKEEILSNLDNQTDYLKVLLEKVGGLQILKREEKVTDLELGFELGFIYRMLQEYSSNSYELNNDIKNLLLKSNE